ncbi:MAG: bifunctional GNAT family N-acetyltransferase/class I SAM-dependent methyltransferase [Candidatus Bipolaricaulota bacterium]|nr:bifunctional GNAT family N-acetyltransferase/class I SAM-dependent methyltransferase [Candidatus Bipolaricaulota bacterium]
MTVFDRWFAFSTERQAQDRAWVNGTDPKAEHAQLDAMIPVLLPKGMDSPNHAFRIARDETGEELGLVWVGVLPDAPKDACVLFDIYVHAAHRGRGVARAMLEQIFESLKADGVHTVLLYVRSDNAQARALYKKLGFVEGEAPTGKRNLEMQKSLEADVEDARMHVFERQLVAVEGLPASGAILDIGGGGEGVIGLIAGQRVVAIDRLKEELEEAPAGPLKIVMDARDLQFLDGSFETATAFFSLMYMGNEHHQRVFEEVFRVLEPGGRFLIWDAVMPPRGDETKDIAVFAISVPLPGGKEVSTRYGVRWPAEGRDAGYYPRLAEAAGFEVLSQRATGQRVFMELRRL